MCIIKYIEIHVLIFLVGLRLFFKLKNIATKYLRQQKNLFISVY